MSDTCEQLPGTHMEYLFVRILVINIRPTILIPNEQALISRILIRCTYVILKNLNVHKTSLQPLWLEEELSSFFISHLINHA